MKQKNVSPKRSIGLFLVSLQLSTLPLLLLFATNVEAADSKAIREGGYEEVSYDDLVNELSQQNAKLSRGPRDEKQEAIKIHAGVGYVTSFSSFRLNDSPSQRFLTGIQLSLGIDLFSQHLFSEINFKNYGIETRKDETLGVKQLDLRIGYRDALNVAPWGYRLGAGLSNRFLKYSSSTSNVNETAPALSATAGIDAIVSRSLLIGIEVAGRTPLTDQIYDKGSVDMSLRVDAQF